MSFPRFEKALEILKKAAKIEINLMDQSMTANSASLSALDPSPQRSPHQADRPQVCALVQRKFESGMIARFLPIPDGALLETGRQAGATISPQDFEAGVSFLKHSGLVRWNAPDWEVRELVRDMLVEMHLDSPSDIQDVGPTRAAARL